MHKRQSMIVLLTPLHSFLAAEPGHAHENGAPTVISGSDPLSVELIEPSLVPDGASAPTESLTHAHSRPSLTALGLPSIG
jgi:hypothetical protein